MRAIFRKTGFLISIFSIFALPVFAFNSIPRLENPVTDNARIINEKTEAQLNAYLKAVNEQTGVQVAVLTVPTLSGESIESFSMRVAESWKLGKAGDDKGVLFTVALEEHEMRIETGYGVEGFLTDMRCGQIIRNEITPYFRDENYSSGIKNGVLEIVKAATNGAKIEGEVAEELNSSSAFVIIPFIVWLAIILFVIFGRARVFPWVFFFGGGSSHGHHGGGFGGSGGGFSGGGGSFGGGGASGKW